MPRLPYFRVVVAGESMAPALRPGDCLVVRRSAVARPGDVVVARRPDRPDLLVVKRVVRRGTDGWWLEGDNSGASDDSRVFGSVERLEGRVAWRYWPWRSRA